MYRVKSVLIGLMALLWLTEAVAESPAWISDRLQAAVNAGPDINADFVATLEAGEPVTLLGKSKDGHYAHIRTETLEGWIAARNLSDQPSIQSRFQDLARSFEKVREDNARLRAGRDNATGSIGQLRENLHEARAALDKVKTDYVALQRASTNVVAIDKRNRQLQDRVIALEQDNLKLRHDNTRLQESQSQKQMYLGAGLVIIGFLLHWLLGLFIVLRRRSPFDEL